MVNQTITQLPTPPSTTDVVNFNDRADNFLAAIPTFVTQTNTVIGQINSTETNINSKESSATSAASTAITQAGIATTKASEANASATAAYNAQLAAEAVFDNFDDKYLGAKATAPTVDNDGNPLVTGALFFKTTVPKGIYVYDAELSSWSIFSHIPTSHDTLSGRSDADSHPMSAITGLVEALADKLSKTLDASINGIKTFLKSPIAPTPMAGDNSTKVATTAFVKAKSEADSIGVGQTWQDVTASRTSGTTYTNSIGKPIFLLVFSTNGNFLGVLNISGISVNYGLSTNTAYAMQSVQIIVPNNSTYSVTFTDAGTAHKWLELR